MTNNAQSPLHIATAVGAAYQLLQKRFDNRGKLTGVSTGFHDLDAVTDGLQRSHLIVLGSRVSVGKSALALNIVQHVAIEKKLPVLFFSLDQSKEMLIRRMLCSRAKIDANKLRTGFIQADDWIELEKAQQELRNSMLYIDDRSVQTVAEMAKTCVWAKDQAEQIGLVVVDYLQIVRFSDGADTLTEIMQNLKGLAVELDSPILALSQLPRNIESRKNKRPVISDLPWTEDADMVAFIYRDDYYDPESKYRGEAEIIIARQKHGPIGTVELTFESSTSTFQNKVCIQ